MDNRSICCFNISLHDHQYSEIMKLLMIFKSIQQWKTKSCSEEIIDQYFMRHFKIFLIPIRTFAIVHSSDCIAKKEYESFWEFFPCGHFLYLEKRCTQWYHQALINSFVTSTFSLNCLNQLLKEYSNLYSEVFW